MCKLLTIPSNLDIEKTLDYTDGYIFGINGYSVNLPFYINLDELKKINTTCKKNNKDLFIALNKNFYSSEIEEVKQILKELDELDLKGILYADTCLVVLKEELNLKTPLVWSQEHLTTNYETINNWFACGVEYTYLSGEITKEEIFEIIEKSKSKLIVPIFGYLPIYTSKRHAVKNYLNHFNLKDNSKTNYIEKEDKIYPIVDANEGTVVYTSDILNGYEEYLELTNVAYVTLNSFNIDDDKFIEVLKTYKERKGNIEHLFNNLDKGFLYKETIYRVK